MKILDLLTSNSGNTFDKTINISYNLYTLIKNDALIINFDDSTQQALSLTSCSISVNFLFKKIIYILSVNYL